MIQFSSSHTVREYHYTEWKAALTARGGNPQSDSDGVYQKVWFYDGPEIHYCFMLLPDHPVTDAANYSQAQNDADLAAFQVEFADKTNQPIAPKTPDGRLTTRISAANRTQNFKLRAISFYTADLERLHNVSPITDADYKDTTVRLYKADGSEITTHDEEEEAVKTVLDFEPHYDYEIIGGFADFPPDLRGGTTDQWYIAAIGAPDYPPEYYGSIDFISEVNIEAVTTQKMESNGRAVSFMPYNLNGMPHTNRLRFIVKHPPGAAKRFQVYIEHFTS